MSSPKTQEKKTAVKRTRRNEERIFDILKQAEVDDVGVVATTDSPPPAV